MKYAALTLLLFAHLVVAGPLKVVTFPILHPKQDVHAVHKFVNGIFKAGKAVLW